MKLKNSRFKDARFVYNLRNSYENRSNSVNTGFISYKSHEKWFKKALVQEIIFKISFKKKDCGYIRLTKKKKYTSYLFASIKNLEEKNSLLITN